MINANEHSMYKEILQQPEVLQKLIKKHVKNGRVVFPELIKENAEIKKIKRAIFLGCGTSFHAAMYGNYIFEEIAGLPCEFEMAEEFVWRRAIIEKGTAVIILSQSGQTTDILMAAYKARSKGATLITLTNKPKSTLAKVADIHLEMNAGEEFAIAATKTFTAEMALVFLLALFLRQGNKPLAQKYKKMLGEFIKIPQKIQTVAKQQEKISKIAPKFVGTKNVYILGDKYAYPLALESALKLKETTYLKAEGMEAGEFRHGPIATVNEYTKIIFLAPLDTTFKTIYRVVSETAKYKARIFSVTNTGNDKLKKLSEASIYIPKTIELFNPFLLIVPIQLLAYSIALAKKIKVDKPRHLTKFVK